jgi:acyl carrier protein
MKTLRDFIESVFDEDYDYVASVKSFREIEGWDSLKYLKLIVAIQAEFGIELSAEQILKITSVGAIDDVLKSSGVAL